MSVIVRDQFMRYYLLTKGADSVMAEKISFDKSKNPSKNYSNHLNLKFIDLKENVMNDLS